MTPLTENRILLFLYQARDNAYAQISVHAGCFLEHLRLYFRGVGTVEAIEAMASTPLAFKKSLINF